MKLHYLVSAVALALGAATVASAQGTPGDSMPPAGHHRGPGGPGGPGHGDRSQRDAMLFKGITLTTAQKDSLKKLNDAQEAQMKALWGQNGQRPDREKMRALREQQQAEFRAVLTDDQKPLYDKNVADIKAVMQQHMQSRNNDRPGSPPPPPPPLPPQQ